jgi:methylated-DNA-[protein]-cysteine S-methyltransferase
MYITFKSKFGFLKISGCERYIRRIEVLKEDIPPYESVLAPHYSSAVDQLKSYFLGDLKDFDLPLMPEGTDFQKSVWNVMLETPYGQTKTYGEVGKLIGNPKASQAIGSACGRNPIPFIIPCHRILAANGLGGFALGLECKKDLLGLEAGN